MAFQLISAIGTQKLFHFPLIHTHQSTKWGGPSSAFCSSNSGIVGEQEARLTSSNVPQLERRSSANFSPSIWGNYFASFSFKHLEFQSLNIQVEALKKKVKQTLMASSDPVKKIELINTLSLLGVSYHFTTEIEKQLSQILESQPCLLNESDYDLQTISLIFRVFRQHGYKIPCDVFQKFKGSDGEFKCSLLRDTKGMLSLYEATHLSVPGEDILDDCFAFTKAYLETLMEQSSQDVLIGKQIANALKQPLHTGFGRVEARKYIDFYEADENANQTILKLAKLDYNRVQIIYQQELSLLSKWWKDLNLENQLPYARDRIVEIYFWMIGLHFEPEFASARIMVAKSLMLLSIVDDTYDAYGTIEELQCFTDAIQRWDASLIDQVPDYLRVLYKAFLDTFSDFEEDMKADERCYSVYFARDAVKKIVRAYHVEAQWCNEGYVPTFDEYMVFASITGGPPVIATLCFMGVGKLAGMKEFEWLQSNPKIITSCAIICRLRDDIVSNEAEQSRLGRHVASGVECYMKQYRVSREEAIKEFERKFANAWKEINEECMRPTEVSTDLLKLVANIPRLAEVNHKYVDAYTNPMHVEDIIKQCFVHPIPI